jgi:hypothetical protein
MISQKVWSKSAIIGFILSLSLPLWIISMNIFYSLSIYETNYALFEFFEKFFNSSYIYILILIIISITLLLFSLIQIKKTPRTRGKGLTIAGLVIDVFSILFWILGTIESFV